MKNLKKLSRNDLKDVFGGLWNPNVGILADGSDDSEGGKCPTKCTVYQGDYITHGTCSKGQGTYSKFCYCSADSAGATLC